MKLSEYRKQIDEADARLIAAFTDRMRISAGIAAYKKEHGLPAADPAREREKLTALEQLTDPDLKKYIPPLYTLLAGLSRNYQDERNGSAAPEEEDGGCGRDRAEQGERT